MVTKIKPRRMNASSSGSLGKDLAYQTESVFDRGVGGGDMKYADFGFQDLTGSTVTLDLSTEVTPTGNFVVVAPSEIKDGQQYILRVNNGATVYTMGLAGNTSNPYNIPLSLTANATDQFVFLAVGGVLELQKNIDRVASVWGGITGILSNQTDLQNALDDKQDELTPSTGISIDSSNNISNTLPGPRISSTAPSNPTEGMEWYDTTNDVLKVYDGSNWKIVGDDAANINVKAFYLSSTSDLTTAQAAYDRWKAGKLPIVNLNGTQYYLDDTIEVPGAITLRFQPVIRQKATSGGSVPGQDSISSTYSLLIGTDGTTVTYINNSTSYDSIHYLDTSVDYSYPYVPAYDGSPTTKKYVDDRDTYIGTSAPSNPVEGRLRYDTTNNQLKVYDGTNRNNVNTQVTVEDNLTSTSTTNALSANQGRILKGQIDDLMALGKFLSLWNASTGQPVSFPYSTPYAYNTGDYFLVSTVSSATPPVNYRPTGSSYTGTASSTAETDELEVGDVYIYDGSVWLLQSNHGKTVTFANIAGQPTDNTNLATALAAKQDTLISGTNIKTVNSTSLLGSGNIAVQPTLVSGTNIKTINGNSILGSGNITVSSSTTITVTLTSAGWSSNSQTVSATGVTASNTVIVSPAPADIADYADCGVYCSAQGSGTLTFGCDTAPSGDIVVNVLIMS